MKTKLKLQLFAILSAVIVVFVFLLPEKTQQISGVKPPLITKSVLKSLYEQNTDKRLEYAESKPIILSMTQYLHQFDQLMQIDSERARAPLTIVERRLIYLQNKGLDVSGAKKILRDHVTKYIINKP